MNEELKMFPENKSPIMIGLMTYVSFIVIGFVPLLSYILSLFDTVDKVNVFLYSSTLTFAAFLMIGYLKSIATNSVKIKGILETLLLGGVAAILAFYAGSILEKIIN
jgi:VIT1/CCC1 family predicted Fe2+/Mn2+ transporter